MKKKRKKKVIVAMSGGVDSSIAAWMLLKKKYLVEALFMKNWEGDDKKDYCSSEEDLKDAKKVCKKLNIFLHKLNFSYEYWEKVFKNFLFEYKIGNTPNPDILCNKEIKFKIFLNYSIQSLKADYIATGHYVQKKKIKHQYSLLRSTDKKKDQSYFLYTLNQKKISKILFPIGHLQKKKVRKIASLLKLVTAKKKDSTGLCFISPKRFSCFLKRFIPKKVGKIFSVSGELIGKHNGLFNYTIGQRKGLKIGGIKGKDNKPWYVVGKKVCKNSLIVAQKKDNIYLKYKGFIIKKLYWINKKLFLHKQDFHCTVKIRYRQKDVPCTVYILKYNNIKVIFQFPQKAVVPGQSAVFYFKEICLGGGIIKIGIPLVKIK